MDATRNYKLKKPEATDVVNIEDLNENADILDGKLKEIEAEVSATKKSVSDGKSEIAAAITQKKVSTAADATFSQMAANIKSIIAGSGNATAADVLAGKTFTNSTGVEQTGTIPSKGAATINPTPSTQTIKAGQYLSGDQTIGSLGGNAQLSQVLSGVTFSSNTAGRNVTGTLAVQSILSFSAAVYSSTAITFTWKNPAKGPFSGIQIRGRTGSYPANLSEGTVYYEGAGNNVSANGTSSTTVSGFASGTTYYFRAWSYTRFNGVWTVHSTTFTASTSTTKGQVSLTSSGTWTVPAGVRSIDVFCVGGGASGSNGYFAQGSGGQTGAGGGSGYTATRKGLAVTPGAIISYTIGAGGAVDTSVSRKPGGDTSFGSYLTAAGGGAPRNYIEGGAGGSGGASAGHVSAGEYYRGAGGSGGSNGSDGGLNSKGYGTPGKGQGTTTRAFGESSNTLYAGAGGGANASTYTSIPSGGSGGGGNGGYYRNIGTNDDGSYIFEAIVAVAGANSTGSGGGGGLSTTNNILKLAGAGGSGVILVRWGY